MSLRDQYILWLLDRDPDFAAKLLGWKSQLATKAGTKAGTKA